MHHVISCDTHVKYLLPGKRKLREKVLGVEERCDLEGLLGRGRGGGEGRREHQVGGCVRSLWCRQTRCNGWRESVKVGWRKSIGGGHTREPPEEDNRKYQTAKVQCLLKAKKLATIGTTCSYNNGYLS